MSKAMRLLIMAACITVIAVGSVWLIDRSNQRQQEADLAAATDAKADRERVARCREMVRKASTGSEPRGIEFCRAILEIERVESAD